MIKTVAKLLAALVAVVVLFGAGGFVWAKSASSDRLSKVFETHRVDFPIPFPLTESEIAELRAAKQAEAGEADKEKDVMASVDLAAVAKERAIERGKHLVEARYACIECHGKNFGGGTMIDTPPIGTIKGMNLTLGEGGVVSKYTAADWDRIVRHGVLPEGRPAAMPSSDYFGMSDHELSDIIMYVKTFPPVNATVPRPTLGPVGTVLMATGKLPLSAYDLKDHQVAHLVTPPKAEVSDDFGKHLLLVCTGCHRTDFSGGPVAAGDPAWPPASNLTPHTQGLAGWTYDDFLGALRQAKRKDGTALRPPMSLMKDYADKMTDTELKAMWAYLQKVPAKPTPTE
jgi:mono/diheme cytochrome c family protein